eukprot:COSAG02_NODE_566_length_20219_cov_13.531759_18_plen_78_part_00
MSAPQSIIQHVHCAGVRTLSRLCDEPICSGGTSRIGGDLRVHPRCGQLRAKGRETPAAVGSHAVGLWASPNSTTYWC